MTEKKPKKLTLTGLDNYRKPRQDYADRLAAMTDKEFVAAAESALWGSAYAANNRRSDYHWQATACFDEAARRGKPQLYKTAYKNASGKG